MYQFLWRRKCSPNSSVILAGFMAWGGPDCQKHQENGIPALISASIFMSSSWSSFTCSLSLVNHCEDKGLGGLEVVVLQGLDLVLAAHIPNFEASTVSMLKTNGGNGSHNFVQCIQNCCLPCSIQPTMSISFLLFSSKKSLEEICKDIPHACRQVEAILARDLRTGCSQPGVGFAPTRWRTFKSLLSGIFSQL